jgi:hypothetical protein
MVAGRKMDGLIRRFLPQVLFYLIINILIVLQGCTHSGGTQNYQVEDNHQQYTPSSSEPIVTYYKSFDENSFRFENPFHNESEARQFGTYYKITYIPGELYPIQVEGMVANEKDLVVTNNKKTNQQRMEKYHSNGNISWVIYYFDWIPIKREEYNARNELIREFRYQNDDQGNPVVLEVYSSDMLMYVDQFEYDAQHRLVKTIRTYPNQNIFLVDYYNNQEQLYQRESYDSFGHLQNREHIKHPDQGNQTILYKKEWFRDNILLGWIKYRYDDTHRINQGFVYDSSGVLRKYYTIVNEEYSYFDHQHHQLADLSSYLSIPPDIW